MPTKPKRKSKVSKSTTLKLRHKVLASAMFFIWSGAVIGCVSMAFYFVLYPAQKNLRKSSVAGENSVIWYKPILKAEAEPVPQITIQAGILLDADSATVLWTKNSNQPRPIASLTKLVTALSFLETNPDLKAIYKIPKSFNQQGQDMVEPGDKISTLKLRVGDSITYKDLLFSALIGSANNAALALVDKISTGKNPTELLNNTAYSAGARNFNFTEASGLDPQNSASALDLALIANTAFSNPIIQSAVQTPVYSFQTLAGEKHNLKNTDKLLTNSNYQVIGGKTGYLQEAGYNLVIKAEKDSRTLMLILLGNPTSEQRFSNADALLTWGFTAFDWQIQR